MYIRLTGDCKLYIDVSLNIVCLSELAQQQTLNSSWVYYTFCQLENTPALAELDKWRKMGCIFFLASLHINIFNSRGNRSGIKG